MNRKQLFLWSLYDFANSIVFVNFLLYFAAWLVIDAGLSDFWYNAIFAITTILLLFVGPILAALTDKRGNRKAWLNISTLGTFMSYGAAALFAHFGTHYMVLSAVLFLMGQFFYQLSFIFYNPMLEDIADPSYRARASGIGQFANSLGQVVGILISLPLVYSRTVPLLLSVAVSFVLALPMMLFFRGSQAHNTSSNFSALTEEVKAFFGNARAFFSTSVAAPVLVAFFFFNGALLTVSNNYSVYLDRVFGVPDATKSILLIVVLVMAAVGGFIAGWIGDRLGALKSLKIILVGWMITLPLVALAPNFATVVFASVLMGFLGGSVWAITRAYVSVILPPEIMGYGFSFYAILERMATLVSPLVWGGIIGILGTHESSYRIAAGAMTVFVVIGLVILSLWKKNTLLREVR